MRFFACFIMVLLAGCSEPAPEINQYGEVSAGMYSNSYFGVQLRLPVEWFQQSEETMQFLEDTGRSAIAGDDQLMNAAISQAEQFTQTLFTVSKYQAGTPVDFNPNMIGMVERVTHAPGISSEWAYIDNMRQLIERSNLPYTFERTSSVNINGIDFVEMRSFMQVLDTRVNQIYRIKYKDGYVLSFILTYSGSEQRDELENFFSVIESI